MVVDRENSGNAFSEPEQPQKSLGHMGSLINSRQRTDMRVKKRNMHLLQLQAPSPGDNSTRTTIETSRYIQVVIYDHITRRKT